jgi:hypothetical protein
VFGTRAQQCRSRVLVEMIVMAPDLAIWRTLLSIGVDIQKLST